MAIHVNRHKSGVIYADVMGMNIVYHIIEIPWDTLRSGSIIVPSFLLLLALALLGVLIDIGKNLLHRSRHARDSGNMSGQGPCEKINASGGHAQLLAGISFSDAVELYETGTVRDKTLEDKMAASIVPIEMLFMDDDHGLYYQFEMEKWSEGDVASWVEVTKALNLAEVSTIMEEVMLMYGVIRHPEYDPEFKDGDEKIGEKLWKRAAQLRAAIVEIDGIAQLKAASEAHLQRNPPTMPPPPIW